jgi:hypothetical protein
VALAGRATKYLAGTGHLELLSNGFACFDHGKREERNGLQRPCKVNSSKYLRKRNAPP